MRGMVKSERTQRISSWCCRNISTASTPSPASSTVKPRRVSMVYHVAYHVPRLRPAAPCRPRPFPGLNRIVWLSGNFFSRYRQKDPKDAALARFALHRDAPWCARTIPRTTGNPRPRPMNLVEKNGSKIFSISSSAIHSPHPPLPGRRKRGLVAASRRESALRREYPTEKPS